MSCGVGHRHDSDPALLWLWCGLAATAPIQRLAWEPPYAAGAALKGKGEKKERKEKHKSVGHTSIHAKYETWTVRTKIHPSQGFSLANGLANKTLEEKKKKSFKPTCPLLVSTMKEAFAC